MGTIGETSPVKLITGMLGKDRDLLREALSFLKESFGEIDYTSDCIPFTFTDYYAQEMGEGLWRQFCSFGTLIDPFRLAEIKIRTNELEDRFALFREGRRMRQVNLDPGYIGLSKLVLASVKDRSHRIYIGKGIYAEVTLQYEKKTFKHWHWTYPDFQTDTYITILNSIRDCYARQLKDAARS